MLVKNHVNNDHVQMVVSRPGCRQIKAKHPQQRAISAHPKPITGEQEGVQRCAGQRSNRVRRFFCWRVAHHVTARAAREQPASDFDLCNSQLRFKRDTITTHPLRPLQDELSPLRSLCLQGSSLRFPRSSPAQRLRRGCVGQDQAFPDPSSPGTPPIPLSASVHLLMCLILTIYSFNSPSSSRPACM